MILIIDSNAELIMAVKKSKENESLSSKHISDNEGVGSGGGRVSDCPSPSSTSISVPHPACLSASALSTAILTKNQYTLKTN